MISPVEEEILHTLTDVRERLSAGILSRPQFQETMGMIRDAILKLERKKAGCIQGLHFTACYCTDRNGTYSKNYRKRMAEVK